MTLSRVKLKNKTKAHLLTVHVYVCLWDMLSMCYAWARYGVPEFGQLPDISGVHLSFSLPYRLGNQVCVQVGNFSWVTELSTSGAWTKAVLPNDPMNSFPKHKWNILWAKPSSRWLINGSWASSTLRGIGHNLSVSRYNDLQSYSPFPGCGLKAETKDWASREKGLSPVSFSNSMIQSHPPLREEKKSVVWLIS